MADSLFSTLDYTQALTALLPRGRVWPKDPGSAQHAVMAGFAPTFQRLDARAQTLLVEAFPATTTELLPEWEDSLGLPDPCDGPDQTVDQRRAQVLNKFVSAGGQSVLYFEGVLARLGYPTATITQYAPFRVGIDHVGFPIYGIEWIYHWTINLPTLSIFWFEVGVSSVPGPLFAISDQAVFCVIDDLKPAHTTVDFTNIP
ncbi:MAG: putative phage tail protein [Pseudomonadota bacterium]